jgi:TonB family protein
MCVSVLLGLLLIGYASAAEQAAEGSFTLADGPEEAPLSQPRDRTSCCRTAVLATVLMETVTLGANAQEIAPKLLPGNKACEYPPAARRKEVAGLVPFVAQVSPEGLPNSIDIRSVAAPDLGFEEAVKSCVAQWRFEPAEPGQNAMRPPTPAACATG